MRSFKYALFLFLPMLFFAWANAQEMVSEIPQIAPQAPLEDLMKSMGGHDGLGFLALVALMIQVSMFSLHSKLGSFAGKYRLGVLYALSIIGGVITLKLQGLDTFSALTHSNSMAAYQVFLHQIYKQFFVKAQEGRD